MNSNRKERQNMKHFLSEYIVLSPAKQFFAKEYMRFFQDHPFSKLNSDQFQNLIDFSLLDGYILNHYTSKEIGSNPYLNQIHKIDNSLKLSELFKFFNFPNCFHCNTCNYFECNLPFNTLIWKRLKERMKLTSINQSNLFI